jgi:asparagine synthase (glutamine-hydrolysing)
MCGIVGIVGSQEPEWIEAMNGAIVHRGPDGAGVFRDREGELALAMRRLAIVDIEGGAQPMSIADGRYVIVFNGEIFNAPQLRRDMEQEGEQFLTDHSDTEVLLRLLVRQGENALKFLDGMFAFAFYDRQTSRLLCARDRTGIKPLYYVQVNGRLAIASELKCFLNLPWVETRIDRQSLFDYLSLMYVPGERTILEGVHRLPPGHWLSYELKPRRLTVRRWWQPEFRPNHSVSAREWPDRIRDTLVQSVKRWSLSDVPVACSLSGGLDSSSVVAALAQNGGRVQTVSLGFTGPGEGDWNELPLARAVAGKWGTKHREIVLEPETLLSDLGRMVWYLDEPYGGGLPSWSVFKRMSETVKVAFTGTGGDELFGNYGKWRHVESNWWRWHRGAIDQERFRHDFFERFYYFPDQEKRRILADGGADARDTSLMLYEHFLAAGSANVRDRVAYVDLQTQLPEEFLMMTDRFAMAHSLEARTPFLANDMVELALQIPADVRTRSGDLKGLLRESVAPLLPSELRQAPKRGFVIPLKLWLRGRLRPLAEQLLDPRRLAAQGIFQPSFFESYVRPHVEGKADYTNRVWAALMFQLWHKLYLERPSRQKPELELRALAEA